MKYDIQCLRLAVAFLEDEERQGYRPYDDSESEELAEEIQRTIEEYLESRPNRVEEEEEP